MKIVVVVCKPGNRRSVPKLKTLLPELFAWLHDRGYGAVLHEKARAYLSPNDKTILTANDEKLIANKPALIITLGGDGTLLGAARTFAKTGVPVLSVNLGHLGFLSEVRLSDLYTAIESWEKQTHVLDVRTMLCAELWRGDKLVQTREALNEAAVTKTDFGRMGKFLIELNGNKVAQFLADGVMVSTTTGSTAYNLASGGPILNPDVDAFVVTPVSPHLLTLRPLVVRSDASITIRVVGAGCSAQLAMDGQSPVEICSKDVVHCFRSKHTVNLVRLKDSGFFEAMRSKLSWGEQ